MSDFSTESSQELQHTPSKDERTFAMLSHLLSIFVGFWAPLIIWLIKKDEMPFVADQAKEALNFQITMLIAFIAAGVLVMILIGLLLIPLLLLANLVLCLMAALKANEGVSYRYPFAFRFIK